MESGKFKKIHAHEYKPKRSSVLPKIQCLHFFVILPRVSHHVGSARGIAFLSLLLFIQLTEIRRHKLYVEMAPNSDATVKHILVEERGGMDSDPCWRQYNLMKGRSGWELETRF